MLGVGNVFSTRCQNSLRAVGKKITLTYTSSDLVGKSITNITAPSNLRYAGHLWTELGLILQKSEILSLMTDRTMSSGKWLLQSVPVLNSTSSFNLDSEHIINARCVRVLIRFIFRFFWTKWIPTNA